MNTRFEDFQALFTAPFQAQ